MRRTSEDWAEIPYTRLKLTPYSAVIGAEVHGVDLSGPLDDATRDEVRRALLEWKVLFFRDQHLTSAEQLEFARADSAVSSSTRSSSRAIRRRSSVSRRARI